MEINALWLVPLFILACIGAAAILLVLWEEHTSRRDARLVQRQKEILKDWDKHSNDNT